MWKDLELKDVQKIERVSAEFVIWMHAILPYGKMKIRIYEDQEGIFSGITDLHVKRKFDGDFEAAVGFGKTVEEALSETVRNFNKIIEQDYPKDQYPNGLSEDCIEYAEPSDF
ncbi:MULTISPECIES: hypothetical protein [unclassified Enterococcus]|uniref:hypothetical protein n=1 Tax=unclassified Enterococcus TaxID=2608891 RepID=UPI001CE0B96C|nr:MULTISPECIES: hypothetical protein [unclassified Enterococcus]MCA5014418.1 hypothetical protein [Enterococcus sp. S23]MCA5017468.1 hypothetical protein [Enterococcus sp. S22(2020)]